jgi:hypothetical protein
MATGSAAAAETVAVVFICDRQGAALERRERCLKLAGISYRVQAERRPSGTYYKLYVPEQEALAAHLALQMGGCGRATRLRDGGTSVVGTVRDIAATLWDELLLLLGRVTDLVRSTAPRLLGGPSETPSS